MDRSHEMLPTEAELPPEMLPAVLDAVDSERPTIPYEQFIAERHKVIDARSRAQQRVDQLVTGGAAGALVLSITFLEKIAPTPALDTREVLILAWGMLLLALGLSLGSHYASCHAFDAYLADFDRSYQDGSECTAENPATKVSRWLDIGSAITFVLGVAALAYFAFVNVRFDPKAPPSPPTAAEQPRVRQEAGPAPAAPAESPAAAPGTEGGRGAPVEPSATPTAQEGVKDRT